MNTLLKRFCSSIMFSIPIFAISVENMQGNHAHILAELDTIKHVFQVSYAPADWKRKYAGWDLENEINKVKTDALNVQNISTKKCQTIIKNFFKSTKDYHVGVRFYSTERASLPFRIKGANGRYFFSYINRNKLSFNVFPFSEGDELVQFGGRPVRDAIDEILAGEISSNENTDRALAEIYLTNRSGSLGHTVPKGPITITVLPNGSSKSFSYQLIWNYTSEKIEQAPSTSSRHFTFAKSMQKTACKQKPLMLEPFFQKQMLVPLLEDIRMDDDDQASDFIGAKFGFIPTLGKIWWRAPEDNPFHAYLFELSDRKLAGYIRIPTYVPESFDDISKFASIIALFQERSDILLIDQLDNPGGSVFYLYAIVSMLTDQPLITPKHRMTITQQDVFFATKTIPKFEEIKSDSDAQDALGDSFAGIPVSYQMAQFFLNFFRFVVEEWNAGRQFTEPFYLYGIDHINPDPQVRYTKPILVLVNSLDFSCGDFFPAILQDNNRVTVLGSRTAGAGGFISRMKFPNLSGIAEIRYTGSIAERLNKNPIENLGVTPDILYEISENDLQYGYAEYARIIIDTLKKMLE